ncbi:ATP-binding protein [Rufibacter roseus]|uniref:AAA family ATPase n=1 Tax=Rufibacter roseus TaxID=1567108 RepID=A0ABW2DM87_9BACT|nr:ATP-binding protein [Rufibacter roseus]
MQAILFTGLQASGKSSFYKQYFFNSHVRISLDLLRTRKRESKFLQLCLQTNTRFVVDNTNPTIEERRKYLALAKEHRYEVIGYFFQTSLAEALARNSEREGKERIKDIGLYDCHKKLTAPSFDEGFDRLFTVQLHNNGFIVEELIRELPEEQ